MSLKKMIAVTVLTVITGAAGAADFSGDYGAVMGKVILPDTERDADYGVGAHVLFGVPVRHIGIPADDLDLEFNGFSYLSQHQSNDFNDYGYGLGLDLHYMLADSRYFGLGFLLGGGALEEDVTNRRGVSPYGDAGFSFNFWRLLGVPNLSIRADARYYLIDRRDSSFDDPALRRPSTLGDAHFNVGFQLDIVPPERGPRVADTDGDGVIDARDECPGTPLGTVVSGTGCPLPTDSDGDGVNDANDRCPNTAPGVAVDLNGCPLVTAMPVPAPPPLMVDSDGDGVYDRVDQCPATPEGAQVDARGCPLPRKNPDLDNDGVLNEMDRCPNTPPGMRVDGSGCVVKQVVVLREVKFLFNSAELTPGGRKILDRVASGLQGQPAMEVEVDGHTDNIGTPAFNLKLSQQRADAVRAYLIRKGIRPTRMRAHGYGEARPVTDNKTDAGRQENRRVEFKIVKQ